MIQLLLLLVIVCNNIKITASPKLAYLPKSAEKTTHLPLINADKIPNSNTISKTIKKINTIQDTKEIQKTNTKNKQKFIINLSLASLAKKFIEFTQLNDKIDIKEIFAPQITTETQLSLSVSPSLTLIEFVFSNKPDPSFTAGNAGMDLYQGAEIKSKSLIDVTIPEMEWLFDKNKQTAITHRFFTLGNLKADLKYSSDKSEINCVIALHTDAQDSYNLTITPVIQKLEAKIYVYNSELLEIKCEAGHGVTAFSKGSGVIDAPQGNCCIVGNKGLHTRLNVIIKPTKNFKIENVFSIEKTKAFGNYIIYENKFNTTGTYDPINDSEFLSEAISGFMKVGDESYGQIISSSKSQPLSLASTTDFKPEPSDQQRRYSKKTESKKLDNIGIIIPAIVNSITFSTSNIAIFCNLFYAGYKAHESIATSANMDIINSTSILCGISIKIGNDNPTKISLNFISSRNCSIGLLNNDTQYLKPIIYSARDNTKEYGDEKSIDVKAGIKYQIPANRDFAFCAGISSSKIHISKNTSLSVAFSIGSQINNLRTINYKLNASEGQAPINIKTIKVMSEIIVLNLVFKLELQKIIIQFSVQTQKDNERGMLKMGEDNYLTLRSALAINLR